MKTLFCQLNTGDTFTHYEKPYMKINPIRGKPWQSADYETELNAVDLKTGLVLKNF